MPTGSHSAYESYAHKITRSLAQVELCPSFLRARKPSWDCLSSLLHVGHEKLLNFHQSILPVVEDESRTANSSRDYTCTGKLRDAFEFLATQAVRPECSTTVPSLPTKSLKIYVMSSRCWHLCSYIYLLWVANSYGSE